ncbi:MAG: SDR family NAD(P)-dependent oxidoreductase, partial [Myxococcales bacterium]|nr:SDR family NAD(P)-dependent oxidoreductase [Myxococcales bacterium]
MRRIVVTGGNKGIGLAIVKAILEEHNDAFVWLAARSPERGRAAVQSVIAERPQWADRLAFLKLDVASDESVASAAREVVERHGQDPAPVHALVNNAGVAAGTLQEVVHVNTLGVRRVCEAFLPLLDPTGGRIVNITSAAGPNFVHTCSPERQRFFLDPDVAWPA